MKLILATILCGQTNAITIQKHNGEIKVESEVGKGSTCTIILLTRLEKTLEVHKLCLVIRMCGSPLALDAFQAGDIIEFGSSHGV